MTHKCKTILIHCMDFRLVRETRRWMEEEGYLGDSDVVSLAGASKELVDGTEDVKKLILEQIKISYKLHNAKQVILLHHSDCGAYNSSYDFNSLQEEKEKQLSDMKTSEEIIKEHIKGMDVIKIWAEMKDAEGENVQIDFV